MGRLRGLALTLLAPFAFAAAACSRDLSRIRPVDRKVLFVGIDGLDLRLLDPFLKQGRLPRLAELRTRALELPLSGEHTTIDPSSVGVDGARSWTTIATGAPAARFTSEKAMAHGVLSQSVRARGRYDLVPVTSQHRRLPAMWDVLGAAGVKCAIVNWSATWPAEAVNGTLVSDRFLLDRFKLGPYGPEGRVDVPPVDAAYRDGAKYLTWPDELADDLAAFLKPQFERPSHPIFAKMRQWMSQAQDPALHRDLSMLRQALLTDWLTKETTVTLVKRDPSIRFCACYLDAFDLACHLFWIQADSQPWQKSSDPFLRARIQNDGYRYASILQETAIAIDDMLGELVDAFGKDSVVVLASDHSLAPDLDRSNRDFNLDPLLERLGLLVRDANGGIDWSKTRCFDRPDWALNFERTLSLNFQGDWPQGWVKGDTTPERVAAWKEIQRQLLEIKVDRTWKLKGVERDTLFGMTELVPWDVKFTVFPGLPFDTKVKLAGGDVPLNTLFPPRRTTAKHAEPGLLFVAAPGAWGARLHDRAPPLGKDAAMSAHIAPFVLALFGIPRSTSDEESGPSADTLYWILEREEAQRVAIGRVESYEATLRRDDPASPLGRRRNELRQLIKELGWFGPAPSAIPPPVVPK